MKSLPLFCGHCGGSKPAVHCAHPACTWVRCPGCQGITDVRGLMGHEDDPSLA